MDSISPIIWTRALGDQFEIVDQLTEAHVPLVRKHKASELALRPLPVLGQHPEPNVLRNH